MIKVGDIILAHCVPGISRAASLDRPLWCRVIKLGGTTPMSCTARTLVRDGCGYTVGAEWAFRAQDYTAGFAEDDPDLLVALAREALGV